MNIELYINKQLCDITNADISIRLLRQFINPTQLNTKDAQMSYEIKLPATPRNNQIFSYANVAEIIDRFKIYDHSEVYIGGVRVFQGKFRLSETARDYYKGNLVIIAKVSISDVFSDTVMSRAGKWIIPFEGVTDITTYNNKTNSECIFPLVLYGLLPKNSESSSLGEKNVFDESVVFALDDFPPSVNCIQMLRQIFKNANYTLSGSALTDERLNTLYVSYKNSNDYEMQWGVGKMQIHGSWKTIKDNIVERNFSINSEGRKRSLINFFDSKNNVITVSKDTGNNITQTDNRLSVSIPVSGLYKLRFRATLIMPQEDKQGEGVYIGDLTNVNTEVKIIKNLEKGLDDVNYDNSFYTDNQEQNIGYINAIFPRKGEVNFIDAKQNNSIVSGFSFGNPDDAMYSNPLDTDYCNPMAIKGGRSWSPDLNARNYSAVQNSGYLLANGTQANKFKVELNRNTYSVRDSEYLAHGEVNQIVWLDKGDTLDIVGVSLVQFILQFRSAKFNYSVNYELDLEPFQHSRNWLTVNDQGASTAPMNWDADSSFKEKEIDLIKFLPNEIKINDWIENFCKAFNLRLSNSGANSFELNIKNNELLTRTSHLIDLDKIASIEQRVNQPLNLPYMYNLGFSIDTSEEGYFQGMEIDPEGNRILNTGVTGGGQFFTGSYGTDRIEQVSSFSYCWYKELIDRTNNDNTFKVPVITDHEIWENPYDYDEMIDKVYFDKSQRFWYKSGLKEVSLNNDIKVDIALVSNGRSNQILDYENKVNSIMRNFFLLLTNNKDYTIVECYLSPEEYSNLPYSLIKFNGDLYHPAEIDEYDPTGRNRGILKLIRRIV